MDQPTPPQTIVSDKVPLRQKLAYGTAVCIDNWGNWLFPNLVWPVFNLYLGVPPWLISTALCLNRLVDAVIDPFFGWWSDNTRTRWGRRRPFMFAGALFAGLMLPMLVWVSPGWDSVQIFGLQIPNYFWYMVASSSVYICIVSLFNVPYQSLGSELTPNIRERTSVYAVRTGIQKLLEIALFAAAAFVTATVWNGATDADVFDRLGLMASRTGAWFSDIFGAIFSLSGDQILALLVNPFGWNTPTEGATNNLLGAKVYTIMLGCLMVVFGVMAAVAVRERYYGTVLARKQESIQLGDTIWKALKCRPFRANLAMAFAFAMGTSMVGTLGYYATVFYVCGGDQTVGGIWNFWMGISNSVLGFFGVPIFAFLAHRFGKKAAMGCVQVAAALIFVGTWWLYDPDTRWLQLFASGLIALTGAGFWMLYGSIGADILDYDELEHGKRREGAFTACGMWIMKVGQALGIGFSGVVLSATGFDASLGANQDPNALLNIRIFLAVIPIVGLVIAMGVLSRFGLTTQRVLEIRTALEERRGKV